MLLALGPSGCLSSEPVSLAQATPPEATDTPPERSDPALRGPAVQAADYPWLDDEDPATSRAISLQARFAPPRGFARAPVTPGSFAAWLRGLPVRTDRTTVLAYDGSRLHRPSAAVILMDVGKRDLMQCADSLIRLHAEFLWANGRAEEAGYRFTSGDLSRWTDWQKGERFVIAGNRVQRKLGSARTDSHRSYRRWLDLIFNYAGTASLARDTPGLGTGDELQAGDFFVDPGFPGHAVMILDIAKDDSGKALALVGQGFMPAEELHVLSAPSAHNGTWFPLPEQATDVLRTPSWAPFPRTSARRFR